MSKYVDYLNVKERNRKGFEINFGSDISASQALFDVAGKTIKIAPTAKPN